jgi:hypothetical protein
MRSTAPPQTNDDEQTAALTAALLSVAVNLPRAAAELREHRIPPERQHTLGTLLMQLGELIHQHADLTSESADTTRQRALWTPDSSGRSDVPPP